MNDKLDDAALDALYPTIARLADLSRTTVGYQKPELEREAVECYRAIAALRARVRELESAPTSGEVASLVKALYARGQKIEWDGGDVSADQQILHAADVIARLDRERQALQAEVIASDDRASRLAGWHDDEVKRADRAESALARVTLERDEARRDAERLRGVLMEAAAELTPPSVRFEAGYPLPAHLRMSAGRAALLGRIAAALMNKEPTK